MFLASFSLAVIFIIRKNLVAWSKPRLPVTSTTCWRYGLVLQDGQRWPSLLLWITTSIFAQINRIWWMTRNLHPWVYVPMTSSVSIGCTACASLMQTPLRRHTTLLWLETGTLQNNALYQTHEVHISLGVCNCLDAYRKDTKKKLK